MQNDIRKFLNNNFGGGLTTSAGIKNNPADAEKIEKWVDKILQDISTGSLNNPWNIPSYMNNDMYNIYFAEEVLKQFQPELLVVNMFDVDTCHSNFSGYCDAMRRADWAVGHLWNTIQNTPGLADDTVLIVAPEIGRNGTPNSIVDVNGRLALDHTNSDPMSKEIFCLVAGPPSVVNQGKVINQEVGRSIDIVPTIANILGFDSEIPGLLPGNVLQDAFCMIKFRNIVGLGILLLMIFACEHKLDESKNPFDIKETTDTTKVKLKDATIEGLHQNVFSVKCANPTCHDGSFEPDFRTVQSTYSSLVYHPVTKNDDQNSYTYRVYPGKADESWIMRRITVEDVLGRMPLYAVPLSTEEIEAIKFWINDGAKDVQGNLPSLPNEQPTVHGYQIQDLQQNRVDTIRLNGWASPAVLQANTAYEFYFYITDDNTLTENLVNQKIEFSYDRDTWTPFHQITPAKLWKDVTKASFNTSSFQTNTTVYLRYFVEDDEGAKTETPEDGSIYWLERLLFNYSTMRIFSALLLVGILVSCSKEEDQLSEVPSLELISIGPSNVVQFEDSVVIKLAYEDGNGDLGGFPADSVNLFVVDNRNGVPFEFRIQELVPGGAEVPIKGTLSITLQNLFLTGSGSQENATFNIYAYDRAGNKSNVVKTPGVVVRE